MTEDTSRPRAIFDRAFLTDVEGVTEVLLIRHGQQEIDPRGPVGDLLDPPLSAQGRQQARLLGAALSTTRIDAIYCSGLRRADETAHAIASHHRLEPTTVPDLREIEIFRDVPPEETLEQTFGKELLSAVRHRMLTERSWDVYPKSEPSYEFRKRAINAVEATIARHQSERICIVCHGGVINAYAGHIIASPYDMFFRPAHTSVSIVAAGDGRRVLQLLNDVHHLRTPEGHFVSY
jgi:broad specificity phosphatase PhoE